MRFTRNNTDTQSAAYLEWQEEFAKEQEAAQLAAQATESVDPVKAFETASNAEAQATLETIRTGYIPDSVLPGVERMNGQAIKNEGAAISNFKWFAENTSSFKIWMARQILDAAERSDLAPIATNYTALHNLMLQYSAYEEPKKADSFLDGFGTINRTQEISDERARQELNTLLQTGWRKSDKNSRLLLKTLTDAGLLPFVENFRTVDAYLKSKNAYPEPSELPAYTKSEQMVVNHQKYVEEIIGHDEFGHSWTEEALDQLDAKSALRLRRLFESGTRGDSTLLTFMQVKDIQQKQDAERSAEGDRQ